MLPVKRLTRDNVLVGLHFRETLEINVSPDLNLSAIPIKRLFGGDGSRHSMQTVHSREMFVLAVTQAHMLSVAYFKWHLQYDSYVYT